MIPDAIGQKLHDRATRGESLTAEEQERLRRWYAQLEKKKCQDSLFPLMLSIKTESNTITVIEQQGRPEVEA